MHVFDISPPCTFPGQQCCSRACRTCLVDRDVMNRPPPILANIASICFDHVNLELQQAV
jgi:hypothetical protein